MAPDWVKTPVRPRAGIRMEGVALSRTSGPVLIRPSAFGPTRRIP